MEEDLVSWDEIFEKTKSLPPRLFRVLRERVRGLPPDKIAARLTLSVHSVKQYNTELNVAFNIDGLSDTERDFIFFVIVRPVVDHILQNPYILAEIEANPDTISYTSRTMKLGRLVSTDPRDATLARNLVVAILIIIVVILVLMFATPILIYLGI